MLVFVFSDPMGNEIGTAVYALLGIGSGLVGMGAWWMTRKARRREGAGRRLAVVAGWLGLAGAVGAGAFLLYGIVFPPFASWLLFG